MTGGIVGVFHLAARGMGGAAAPSQDADMGAGSLETNVEGTHNVLRAAAAAGSVRKVVYAASATVYGEGATPPLSEAALPAPGSPYAASKLMGELLAKVGESALAAALQQGRRCAWRRVAPAPADCPGTREHRAASSCTAPTPRPVRRCSAGV